MDTSHVKWITLALLIIKNGAYAATATTTLPVSTTVANTCDTLTATDLMFGNYDPTSATATDGSSSISVRCTLDDGYTISLNQGTTSGGSISQRLMTNGSQTVNYNLYTTSGRTIIWGDSLAGSIVSGTGTGTLDSYTVYGRIPPLQTIAAGNYSDTITVSVDY